MQGTEIFNRTTEKLYDEAEKRKGDKNEYFRKLHIEIEKNVFKPDEWKFLEESADNFLIQEEVNSKKRWSPIYQISEDSLFTHELRVIDLKNSYYTSMPPNS